MEAFGDAALVASAINLRTVFAVDFLGALRCIISAPGLRFGISVAIICKLSRTVAGSRDLWPSLSVQDVLCGATHRSHDSATTARPPASDRHHRSPPPGASAPFSARIRSPWRNVSG